MKTHALLIALALPLMLAGAAAAMTADELIAKSLEAQGGAENIKAVQTVKTTGKFMMMGMEFPFVTYHARPGMMRLEADINGMQMVQVWNGESGWMINPMMGSMEPQDMGPLESKNFKLQADMDGLLVDYAAKGYTVEYVGEDEVEGTPVHQLKIDTGQDIVIDMFFDTEYFLPIMQRATVKVDEQEVQVESYMSDYKEVGDLVVAHAIETRQGGQTANSIVLDTVEQNVALEDGLFEKPAGN